MDSTLVQPLGLYKVKSWFQTLLFQNGSSCAPLPRGVDAEDAAPGGGADGRGQLRAAVLAAARWERGRAHAGVQAAVEKRRQRAGGAVRHHPYDARGERGGGAATGRGGGKLIVVLFGVECMWQGCGVEGERVGCVFSRQCAAVRGGEALVSSTKFIA